MFNSDLLEVAIGLVFIYLLLSLVATSARESLETFLKQRGRALEGGLAELLTADDGDQGLLRVFYEHPLIGGLYRGDYAPPEPGDLDPTTHRDLRRQTARRLPSYIPATHFALAVMDMIGASRSAQLPLTAKRLALSIDAMPAGGLKELLRIAVQTGGDDLTRVQAFLEARYDAVMERVSGVYRRHTQVYILILSAVLCVALNVNTFVIADTLSHNQALRQSIVAQAQAEAQSQAALKSGVSDVENRISKMGAGGLPIGWGDREQDKIRSMGWRLGGLGWLEVLLGWAATAFAVTLGAPFWFDVLGKLMTVRSTMKPAARPTDVDAPPTPNVAAPPLSVASGVVEPSAAPPAEPIVAAQPVVNLTLLDPLDIDEIAAIDPYERPREDA